MALKEYIAEALEKLVNQKNIDYNKEADIIITRMLDPNYKPQKPSVVKRNITKVESYREFQANYGADVYQQVYSAISQSDEPMSRADIAGSTGLRLSTVCGRVAELIEAGAVYVVGTKIDERSDRNVEVLSTVFEENDEQ